METATVSTWESVLDRMRQEGWRIGYAEYTDDARESVWIVQGVRNGTSEQADGETLDDAFSNLYCLTH